MVFAIERFDGEKIIPVKYTGKMVRYNLATVYGSNSWKAFKLPKPKKGEVVLMATHPIVAGPCGVLYIEEKYIFVNEWGRVEFSQTNKILNLDNDYTYYIAVRTKDCKMELLGKIFLMKDENSFISECGKIELHPFENKLIINGRRYPTIIKNGEYYGGGTSFDNWYLTERLALTIASTNTSLPTRFYIQNRYSPTQPWEEGKTETIEDGPFKITFTHYYDEEALNCGNDEDEVYATKIDVVFKNTSSYSYKEAKFLLGELEDFKKIKLA